LTTCCLYLLMRKLFILNIFFCAFCSCGKTITCSDPPIGIAFISTPATTIDTIILRKFELNSNFQTLIDTMSIFQNINSSIVLSITNDTAYIRISDINKAVRNGFDWQLFIPNTGQTFSITDIEVQNLSSKCGTFSTMCFCYNKVTSIKLDNQNIVSNAFRNNTVFVRR
jgi:hypothetical protein